MKRSRNPSAPSAFAIASPRAVREPRQNAAITHT